MINYKEKETDTLDELGIALMKHQAMTLLYRRLKSMPDYPNKQAHICTVEKRARLASLQIEILSNKLILVG